MKTSKTQLVTLRNRFHGSECRVRVPASMDPQTVWHELQCDQPPSRRARIRRIHNALCGSDDCQCGTVR